MLFTSARQRTIAMHIPAMCCVHRRRGKPCWMKLPERSAVDTYVTQREYVACASAAPCSARVIKERHELIIGLHDAGCGGETIAFTYTSTSL